LQALAEQTTNKVMRDTVKDVCSRVEAGESFSEALIRHPKSFNRLYVAMVGARRKRRFVVGNPGPAGHVPGKHGTAAEKGQDRAHVPTVVSIVAVVITIFLMVKVIPTFKEVYTGFGAALPRPTEIMIDISEILQKYLLYMIVGAALPCGAGCITSRPSKARILGHSADQTACLWANRP